MNMVVWEKLPPLTRQRFGCSSPSPLRTYEDKMSKGAVMKDSQEDIFFYNDRFNPVQKRPNSPRRKIYSEDSEERKRTTLLAGSGMDSIFPPKPGCHRMPLKPSDFQADHIIQKDKNSIKEHAQRSKQTRNRRQDKYDQCKLEHFDSDYNDLPRERGETNINALNGYEVSHKDRLYENELRMTKEIRKKEILLQEKLLKAAESMRQIQLRNAFKDKVKEERRNTERAENSLFYTEKGNWDWESTRGRALGGRRHEGQQEGFNHWVRGKDGKVRQENHVKETYALWKEKSKKGIEKEDRGRNTLRTTKTVETEWDHFEEITRQMQDRARTERDDTRRQRAEHRRNDELREWEQRDWQEKEILRAYDGEKRRRERLKLKKEVDAGNEDQKLNIIDKFALNSHIKGISVSNHDKRNELIKDHLATQDSVHQYTRRATEETLLKQPLPEAGPSTQKGKRLLQEQPSEESNPDEDFQLVRCEVCNRKFKEDRLEKHISICQKTQKPKRQVYNSSQYRAKGTELEEFMKTNGRSKTPERKKSNWRQKHETLVRNMRQARGPAVGSFEPSEDLNPDYVTCPHCNRRFAPGPAERHIPKCQYIKSRPPAPKQRQ